MRNINERPICHRAEDLVTYLYGEASQADALDFANHLQQCDACRSEFAIFNQVHESILVWRNEALGAGFNPAAVVSETAVDSSQFVRHERKLSALAALREFFSVSPLWLRGATAFAALVLCVLAILVISRSWNKPVQTAAGGNEPKVFTKSEFDAAVAREVKVQSARINEASARQPNDAAIAQRPSSRNEVAAVRSSSKPRVRALTLKEREQLAADLRLIPVRDEEELPFVLSDEPNQ
jgi:hypothetical protein